MKITFVRHCETDWNKEERCQGVTDLELNSNGFMQAKKLGIFFNNEQVQYAFCSDLKRAKQTIDNINQLLTIIFYHNIFCLIYYRS